MVFLAMLTLVVLIGGLLVLRLEQRRPGQTSYAQWNGGELRGTRGEWAIAVLAVGLSQAFLIRHLPWLFRADAILSGDGPSHAAIAQSLAIHGAPHGWIDAYDGGFPLAVNYPPLGWGILAGFIRLGIPAQSATQMVGTVPYILGPFLVLWIARAVGVRPLAALVGALALGWIAPYNFWLGTHESYLGLGLVSQSVFYPIGIMLGGALLRPRARRWEIPLYGCLLASSHPQITFALAMLLLPLLFSGPGELRARILRAYASMVITGAALYGYGAIHLRVPFGWIPIGVDWWIAGYTPDRIWLWTAEGRLFDQNRWPIVTTVWLLSAFVLVAFARRKIPRTVLLLALWGFALCIVGRSLPDLGSFGERFVSLLQPQRAFALVPAMMAAVIVVAAEELCRKGEQLPWPESWARRGKWVAPSLVAAALLSLTALAPGILEERVNQMIEKSHNYIGGRGLCGALAGDASWTSGLVGPGRLDSIENSAVNERMCPKQLGLETYSAVPLALSSGAGAHVGVLTTALRELRPETPGVTARAEVLGIRWTIDVASDALPEAEWRPLKTSGKFVLSERIGGTATVGVGCIVERWKGSNDAIRKGMIADLQREHRILADPTRLFEVTQASADLEKEEVPRGACDVQGAQVEERPREPGAYEATVTAPSEVEVVFRTTSFPTWEVRVDGELVPVIVVAPGYPAARLPLGTHQVVASCGWPPYYGLGLGVAGLLLLAISFVPGKSRSRLRPGATS